MSHPLLDNHIQFGVESQLTMSEGSSSSVHPLEGKGWFRLVKVLYIGLWLVGIGFCGIVAAVTESVQPLLIGGIALAILLILLRKVFYYVVLGRTTPGEPLGTGFADLDDLRNDFASFQASDPGLYQKVIGPQLDSWKAQYGRRVPHDALALLRQRIDTEIEGLREKKREVLSKAAREGVTIDIAELRQNIEATAAQYEGSDREEYIGLLRPWLVRLEALQAKYGASVPVDEAGKLSEDLEASISAQEAQGPQRRKDR